jgi:hypothetical protein
MAALQLMHIFLDSTDNKNCFYLLPLTSSSPSLFVLAGLIFLVSRCRSISAESMFCQIISTISWTKNLPIGKMIPLIGKVYLSTDRNDSDDQELVSTVR